jgi:hypothetical protein
MRLELYINRQSNLSEKNIVANASMNHFSRIQFLQPLLREVKGWDLSKRRLKKLLLSFFQPVSIHEKGHILFPIVSHALKILFKRALKIIGVCASSSRRIPLTVSPSSGTLSLRARLFWSSLNRLYLLVEGGALTEDSPIILYFATLI